MTTGRSRTFWLLGLFVAVLLAASPAVQAQHKDDIVTCTDLSACETQDDVPGDSGDAVNLGSVGDDDGPPLSSIPAPSITTVAAPAAASPAANDPQVVTIPASKTPATVTTTTTAPPIVLPTPHCLNHPDYPVVPKDWTVTAGSCFPPPRGEDNYLLCHGDEARLVAFSGVDVQMKSGFDMGIWVDGVPDDRHGNCIITDLTTYKLDPGKYVFSGMYVQDHGPGDGIFNTAVPFPWSAWKPLYPYWVPKTQAAQYVQTQSLLSIQAYGLLWNNGNRYQTKPAFVRYLKGHHLRWLAWKKQYPGFAAALTSHEKLLRRLRRR